MRRDEYEQSKARIQAQHRAAVELMDAALKAQLGALDLPADSQEASAASLSRRAPLRVHRVPRRGHSDRRRASRAPLAGHRRPRREYSGARRSHRRRCRLHSRAHFGQPGGLRGHSDRRRGHYAPLLDHPATDLNVPAPGRDDRGVEWNASAGHLDVPAARRNRSAPGLNDCAGLAYAPAPGPNASARGRNAPAPGRNARGEDRKVAKQRPSSLLLPADRHHRTGSDLHHPLGGAAEEEMA